MKEFAIDDRGSADDSEPPDLAAEIGPVGLDRLPPWLRPLLLLAVLETIALGIFLVALSPRDIPTAAALLAVDSAPIYAEQPRPSRLPGQSDVMAATSELAGPDRITRTEGAFRIELHGADPAQALAMLSEATHATVRGREVLQQRPERITRSLVVRSPLEAWQAVFGDVASFAAHCLPNSCAVRFVSAGEPSIASQPWVPPVAAPVTVTEPVPLPPITPSPDAAPAADAPAS